MNTNLAGLSRVALVNLVKRLASERNQARRAEAFWRQQCTPTFHDWTAADLRGHAAAALAVIDPDPDAVEHRATLAAELALVPRIPRPAARRPGPRCNKGRKWCGRPLDGNGWCTKHDARRVKASRERVAA